MTNFEKYKDKLMEIEGNFAFNKNTREILKCDNLISCKDCIFNEGDCTARNQIKWLCKEYKEPILSDNELELIKVLGKVTGINYKYVVRDACGVIRFFEAKPCVNHTYADIASRDKVLFPNITYKDGLYDIENKCFIKEEGDD